MSSAKMPSGQFSKMPYETLLDNVNFPPDLERQEQLNGVTHYDFRIFQDKNGYGVKARPYANWKERMEWDIKQKGM